MRQQYDEIANTLAAAGVDLLICETMCHPSEAAVAAEAALSTGLPVWVSWSLQDTLKSTLLTSSESGTQTPDKETIVASPQSTSPPEAEAEAAAAAAATATTTAQRQKFIEEVKLRSGHTIEEAVAQAPAGVSAYLFNCAQPESITRALPLLAQAVAIDPERAHAQLGAYANFFLIDDENFELKDADKDTTISTRGDLSPVTYANIAEEWVANGVSLIGGCCGISPDHTAALVDVVHPSRI